MPRSVLLIALFISLTAFYSVLLSRKGKVSDRLTDLIVETKKEKKLAEDLKPEKKNKTAELVKYLRIPENVTASIVSSGIMLRAEEFILIWLTVIFVPVFIATAAGANIATVIVIVLVSALIPPAYIEQMHKTRIAKFGVQLGDALMLLANGIRTGFSFEQVLESVAPDLPEPISSEFLRVSRELKFGMSLEESLTSLSDRMESTDMRLLTSAVIIQRRVGGNLANVLDSISSTIRDRIKIKNDIVTMTAQGRLSGLIIGSLPLIIYLLITMSNPEYTSMLTETSLGHVMLIVAAVMEAIGFIVITKMVNIDA